VSQAGIAEGGGYEQLPVLRVVKGHGTENDFLLIPDLDGELTLSTELVRALCDRHAGIGADGVLRLVRSENDPDGKEFAVAAPFFMDYRNADGTVAEMCGNGVRVFARYLHEAGLVGTHTAIATRGGVRETALLDDGQVRVDMGRPQLLEGAPRVAGMVGRAVRLPNPHVVVTVPDEAVLAALDLTRPPAVDPASPDGQNVEFVARTGERSLALRVHERGVGETRSCGTGICAAVAAIGAPDGTRWRVEVPGGTTTVVWSADGALTLTGPAVLTAEIVLTAEWLARLAR
jgi:diaminopimelate epimerase